MATVNGRRVLMINMDRNYIDMVTSGAMKIDDEWDPVTPMDIDPVILDDQKGPFGPNFSSSKNIIPNHTDQAVAKYIEKNKDTEGFDVEEFKSFVGWAFPIDLKQQPGLLKDSNTLSQMAINMYNKDHGTSYRFIKVLRLYIEPVAGFILHITFVALDENKVPHVGETFQALGSKLVPNETRPDGLTVKYCRVKGT